MLRSKRIWAALLGMIFWAAPSVDAGQISYSATAPLTATDFETSLTIPKFDPNLGVLDKVTISLTGQVAGNAMFESMDSEASIVTMQLAAQIELSRPDMTSLVAVLPMVTTVDNASPFDSVIDFVGPSGKSHLGLGAASTVMSMTTSPADLALFTGPGTISLPLTAMGTSSASGAGNLLLLFNTFASAEAEITYDYTLPEPSTCCLLCIGALLVRRRTRRCRP